MITIERMQEIYGKQIDSVLEEIKENGVAEFSTTCDSVDWFICVNITKTNLDNMAKTEILLANIRGGYETQSGFTADIAEASYYEMSEPVRTLREALLKLLYVSLKYTT